MSPTCGLDIVLQSNEPTRLDILLLLIRSGWSATGWGSIAYRPLGDIDEFAWQSRPAAAWPEVLAILEQKQAAGETLSLELHWQGAEEGGSFHVDADPHYPAGLRVWTVWSPPRPLVDSQAWLADHAWYLQRILPPLRDADIFVAAVTCKDVY